MSRDVIVYLEDMRDACDRVLAYTDKVESAETLAADRMRFDAVVRNLEVLGEAGKHVPEEIRCQLPDVEWRKIVGMRDQLIHNYSGIDKEIVFTAATAFVPPLRAILAAFLARSGGAPSRGA